jgi:hypothetical protein
VGLFSFSRFCIFYQPISRGVEAWDFILFPSRRFVFRTEGLFLSRGFVFFEKYLELLEKDVMWRRKV